MEFLRNLNRKEKVLTGGIVLTGIGVFLMLVSISTDYWVEIIIPQGQYRNSSGGYVLKHHSGLWRICRTELDNRTLPAIKRDYCTRVKLFASQEEDLKDPEIDQFIQHYSRSETAFAVISVALMALGIIFSVYAVKEPRYMFKRLAGTLHIMTAICILVCAEVLINSVNYESENLPARHPEGAYIRYGASFVLVWIVLVIFVVAAIINFYYGRKRKGDRAESDKEAVENEPVHLGRF